MGCQMDKISIIVPVYNVKKYLIRCVESILNQTYSDIEVILVDDGSTDGSGEICDVFNDKRIKVFHKNNEGLGFSRNYGLNQVTGKYVMFVDSDDYLDSDIVSELYTDMIENSADTCIGGFKRVYKTHTDIFRNSYSGATFEGEDVKKEILERMFGKNGLNDDHIEMSVWRVLFSSSIIKENKLRFPSEREFISEDIIFDTDYYINSKKLFISRNTGYNYCDNDDSLTTRYNPLRYQLQKKLLAELKRRAYTLGIYDEVEQRLLNTFISIARYCIKLEQKNSCNIINGYGKIKIICEDDVLKQAFKNYRVNEKFKNKIVNFLMKRKFVVLLYMVMMIKNKFNI